jgi:diguanylate cyclase
MSVGNDIRTIIAQQTEALLGIKITVSVGVAAFPEDAHELGTLLECADKAVYQAKREGRNKVCKFDVKRS